MYLLRCPQGHEIPVAPSAAGGSVACPVCGSAQAVPNLGELRRLPQAGGPVDDVRRPATSFGARIAFALLMLIALAAAGSATFAGFRWQNLPEPITVEEHIAESREVIAELRPVELVGVWEMYEQQDLSAPQPYPYKVLADLRAHWKSVFLISLAIALACVVAAVAVIWIARSSRSPADT